MSAGNYREFLDFLQNKEEEAKAMFVIPPEEVSKVKATVCEALSILNDGAKRVDLDVELGGDVSPIKVYGYWDSGVMTIHIKVKAMAICGKGLTQ